jgi:hypothetical protein
MIILTKVITKKNNNPLIMRDANFVGKPRQTDMDGPIRWSSLKPGREEELITHGEAAVRSV